MEQLQAVVENRTGFRLDPRTKLLLMAVVATAEFLYSHTAFMIAVAMIPFILLLTNRQYKTATVFFCLFAAGLFVQAIQNSVQFPMIVNMLVVLLVGLVLRLFPAFVMGAYIIKSTTASECITALGRMHIGRQITIPLSVLFRFIPTMQEESAAIKDAMRMREVQFGTKKFWQNPAALIEYRFIPLMISVVKIGDDLSAAALTRGLDNPVRRTNITKVGFTAWDLLAVLIAGTALLSTYFFSPWYGGDPVIELKDVSFTYENGETENNLSHINLTIRDGETILLCGESGCGKTTLTRLINGLIPHYYSGKLTGQVLLDGKELKDYPLYQIGQQVGSVFQNPRTQFYNVDTTSEIVFGCENMALPVPEMQERLEETTHSLKLEKLLNRSLFALSGGEKQKIACASADAIHPDIFVLDEPSSNLDIATIEDLIGVIRHWQSEKKTVIVAEHRLYYLVPYADRILYMKHGSIIQEFSGVEFQKLPPDELRGMGLRVLDPFHLSPEAIPKQEAPTLHIKGFQFSYEKHGPLNVDIPDLTLPQGEIIGIIGNNGAGKSTFARCLCGLDKKAKGVLEIDGTSYDAKQRRHISYMVMQDVNHQLFTEDVLDELLLSMDGEDEKTDTARAKEILNSLDLLDKVKLHPMSLSGGEKQRVAIGSAIASDKKILIFDEPTSGLEDRHMLEVSDNLNRLKEMGKSLLLITHDPELIYKCCTYLLFIQGSKVLWHRPMDGDAVRLLRAFFSHEQGAGVCNAS